MDARIGSSAWNNFDVDLLIECPFTAGPDLGLGNRTLALEGNHSRGKPSVPFLRAHSPNP